MRTTFPSNMATIRQVLKVQEQINATRAKLNSLTAKRYELLEACIDLNKPRKYDIGPAETFTTIDAVPCRIKVYSDSSVEKEELTF